MIGRGNRSTRRKPAPVQLCSPQTPHVCPDANPGLRGTATWSIYFEVFVTFRWWPSLAEICKGSILLLKIFLPLMEFSPSFTCMSLIGLSRSVVWIDCTYLSHNVGLILPVSCLRISHVPSRWPPWPRIKPQHVDVIALYSDVTSRSSGIHLKRTSCNSPLNTVLPIRVPGSVLGPEVGYNEWRLCGLPQNRSPLSLEDVNTYKVKVKLSLCLTN
jgi:hypothetical protein